MAHDDVPLIMSAFLYQRRSGPAIAALGARDGAAIRRA
ncbi:hypothetical protein C100_12820 [Sphingobium sp. C100]|nr:hypothetical protein C100_12820 [Sphingobium sp. C100]